MRIGALQSESQGPCLVFCVFVQIRKESTSETRPTYEGLIDVVIVVASRSIDFLSFRRSAHCQVGATPAYGPSIIADLRLSAQDATSWLVEE